MIIYRKKNGRVILLNISQICSIDRNDYTLKVPEFDDVRNFHEVVITLTNNEFKFEFDTKEEADNEANNLMSACYLVNNNVSRRILDEGDVHNISLIK